MFTHSCTPARSDSCRRAACAGAPSPSLHLRSPFSHHRCSDVPPDAVWKAGQLKDHSCEFGLLRFVGVRACVRGWSSVLVANSGLIVTLCNSTVYIWLWCLQPRCRQPLAASAAFHKSHLLNLLYFPSFVFIFVFLFFRFGASSRSRAVKYSFLCCVLKIRLISTPSLFSSSASPLSLPSDDEQQKHVYLARFAFFPPPCWKWTPRPSLSEQHRDARPSSWSFMISLSRLLPQLMKLKGEILLERKEWLVKGRKERKRQ